MLFNVDFTETVDNNGAIFSCYFSKARSFNGIFLNFEFFNSIDPIFPKIKDTPSTVARSSRPKSEERDRA